MITIYQQPASVTFARASKFDMSVGAETDLDDGYLTYQWQYTAPGTTAWASVQHPSATSMVLTILPALTGPYGSNDFRCIIVERNNAGTATGQTVTTVTASSVLFDGRTAVGSSKSRNAADIRSRLARHQEFEQDPALNDIMTGLNIGGATLADASDHINTPNVQSALVCIAGGMTLPVGAVITERKNIDPSGRRQQTMLSFSGTVASPIAGQPALFDIFGYRVSMADSAIASQVRDAALTILADMEAAGTRVIDVAAVGTTGISFSHRDHAPHVPEYWLQHGIEMSGIVSSPATPGYGQWTKFAETNITGLDTTVTKLYHWERII